jgi:hypothetical protein
LRSGYYLFLPPSPYSLEFHSCAQFYAVPFQIALSIIVFYVL